MIRIHQATLRQMMPRRRWFPAFACVIAFALFVPTAASAAPGAPDQIYFPQTGHYVSNGFLAYWEHFGGAATFGYPITDEIQENGLTVQYFERSRFEWHPGSDPAHFDVELGLVGEDAATTYGMYHIAVFEPYFVPPATPIARADCVYFPQTHHNLCAGFRAYWQQSGGLARYGYPISEEFVQDPSTGIVVQYFERARFEWHPGTDPTRYGIELGRVGVDALALRHPTLLPQCHC